MNPRPRSTPRTRGRSHRVGNAEVGTGEYAHRWLEHLVDAIQQNPIPVVVDDPGTDHGRRLVLALGAQIHQLHDEPQPEPVFRGRPESFYRHKIAACRERLRQQGLKDTTPGRDRPPRKEPA